MKNDIKNPREVAVNILYEVEYNDAYTNLTLKKWLSKAALSQNDVALATSLVYGTEKNKLYLDAVISSVSKTPIKKISPWILIILRVSIFQMYFLDKVPAFASVNEGVKLGKRYESAKAGGFVNGVLRSAERNMSKIKATEYPDHIKLSVPNWLIKLMSKYYGRDFAIDYFKESLGVSPLTVRVNTAKTNLEELTHILKTEGVTAERCCLAPDCLVTNGLNNIKGLKSHEQGLFFIQDEGAMLSVEALEAELGNIVLDMCAAPGGKTTHIAQKIGNTGRVIARDVHNHKMLLIESNLRRLGIDNVKIEIKDGLIPDKSDMGKYDRVLLDAPCSGLGILRRKPDIKYKLSPQKIHDIVQIQKRLILNAFDSLSPGGYLVYTTCTVNPRENEEVVEYLLKNRETAHIDANLPKEMFSGIIDEKGYVKLFPNIHGTDGFFIVRLRKKTERH
ncbi:MAG TPA: 16S rRNA (cytosine(967)-C(5))-methyltransferase RsmB [Eubacteriaceae bacterium]|jgi:16S rRNA (cytosine967-C5)-methyltransferase|nr:16S rRNA (cytosine(967)-C(5))-methyltransferase RsmB [Eubacteriaceae bacterium]